VFFLTPTAKEAHMLALSRTRSFSVLAKLLTDNNPKCDPLNISAVINVTRLKYQESRD
jgi:hypothetical protein